MYKPNICNKLKLFLKNNKILIIIFLLVLFFYSFSANKRLLAPQKFHHYNYLADSFLKGQISIDNPPTMHDLSPFNNKLYVPFPILPAIVLMPFVFFFGVQFKVIYITILLGAINTILVYKLLRKINSSSCLLLTLAFAFGTVHWSSTIKIGVWFMAHIFAVFFLLLALIESVGKKRAVILALLLGCAFMCRQMTILSVPYFIYVLLKNNSNNLSIKKFKYFFSNPYSKKAIVFLFILSLFVLQYLIYNYLRFGNPFDTGYQYIQLGGILKERFSNGGLFSFNHFPFNLYVFLFQPPIFISHFPYLKFDPQGLALIFTSPFLFYAFKNSFKKTIHILIACILVFLPQLFYYNTGWCQFGYRFILDILPFLILLVGYIKFNKKDYYLLLVLVFYSIIINGLGVGLIQFFVYSLL